MARFAITEGESEQILRVPKSIAEDVRWIRKSDKTWLTAKLDVLSESADLRTKLTMVITVNTDLPSKFSFTLLLNNTHRLRSLDVNGSHENKCSDGNQWRCATHKHTWSDACPGGGHAYTPNDITATTIRETFHQFCKECNIEFRGNFPPVITQPTMPRV